MCNAKKGDIVRPTKAFLEWQNENGVSYIENKEYAVVDVKLFEGQPYQLVVNNTTFHINHLTLVKTAEQLASELAEEKKMQQQAQQKTKRIPFSEEDWKKYNYSAKVVWKPTDTEVLYFSTWYGGDGSKFIGVYKAPKCEYSVTTFIECDFNNMELEIPITTKRIPFDASRKDAKVFVKNSKTPVELIEWYQMKTGVVSGVYIDWKSHIEVTELYHPNNLEMEIEE